MIASRATCLERLRRLGVELKEQGDYDLGDALMLLAARVALDGRESQVRALLAVIRSL